ncbi:uncharacterized protein LOC131053452 [Cryptomeria japonica]|uniref:uncharacterized protein LOC131053452 n=1 Tax=Cryptomeria japonica TaxID=3369 RepID=UPI0025AC3230|nr:uncharacterized protein LOC131053452 [Cryptomeria japonica]
MRIRIHAGGAYADVFLSDRGKEVALLLCVDDWNYEVVYWLLNSWSNSQMMNGGEVRGGNIPPIDVKKFEEMNKMMGYVARRLGEEGGKALEKSRKTKYTGKDSVKEVLSGMIKIVTTEEDIVNFMGRSMVRFSWYEFEEHRLPDSVKTVDVAEPFWSFVCDSFAGYLVKICACTSLVDIRKMKTNGTGQNNWRIATSLLFHLSHFLIDIIHKPMGHNCKDFCTRKILRNAAEKAAGNQQKFIEMLQKNAMWRCYDDAAALSLEDAMQTVLHSIVKFRDEDVGTEVAQALLCKLDEQSIKEFMNAADERGRTALHSASEKGNARICRLLADHGALVTAHDKKGMTALHSAFEGGTDKVIDVETEIAQVLLSRCDKETIHEFVNAADNRGRSALHRASEKGNTYICELLVGHGVSVTAKDNFGMTALHYAFEGTEKLIDVETKITETLLCGTGGDDQSISEFVNAVDRRGRTALRGASKNGNASVCKLLVNRGALVTVQDKNGMTALHHASEGKINKVKGVGIEIAQVLLGKWDESSIYDFVNAADKRGRTALHGASENGDARICKLLVDRGALVTAQDKKGMTALHYAFEGEVYKVKIVGKEIVNALLIGYDGENIYKFVNIKDERGRTALHCASEKGTTDICKLLVDHRALLTAQDNKGMTALNYAFEGGTNKVVEIEIEIAQALPRRCDSQSINEFVNAKDEKGKTALHWASEKGNAHICELLVNHGALVTDQDKNGMTALHYAFEGDIEEVKNVGKEITQVLLRRCDDQSIYAFVNTKDKKGRTALHCASEKGNTDVCKLLVDHCALLIAQDKEGVTALLTAQDKRGMTALHYAFVGGINKDINVEIDIANALLNRCDERSIHMFVNTSDKTGRTALHIASEKGSAEICKMLIDRGASVNAKTINGNTTLHHSFEGGIGKDIDVMAEIAEALLCKCDEQSKYEFVNAADEKGGTALHLASEKGNIRICELLVNHGASVIAQNNHGMTALHYAFKGGIGKDIDVTTEITESLLRSCDEGNEEGMTALHLASEKGNIRICELLVNHGASVLAQNNHGKTAPHYAFVGGIAKDIDVTTEITETLLRRCDEGSTYEFVNAADKKGMTALHSASQKGDARICRLLVDHGASMTAQNERGKTALHYALEGGIHEVIDLLVKSPHVSESLDLKDGKGYTPLGIALTNMDYKSTVKLLLNSKNPEDYLGRALANMNYETIAKLLLKSKEPEAYLDIALPRMDYESTAKLLSKLKQPEAYFDKVDQEQLLRNSLLLGSVGGDCDENGKTALHLAAMCDDEQRAHHIMSMKIERENLVKLKNMVAERDKGGRTVLHEAALNGNHIICIVLLNLNSELIYIKDRDNRNPLFDAVKGKYTGTALYQKLLTAYFKKDKPDEDLVDRSGLTPLHIAASQGKVQVVKEFLSWHKIKTKYLSRKDFIGQTALHKAVKCGYIDTVEILLNHGAHPLRERDCDGRTALHYAVQAETGDKEKLARMLFSRCESDAEKSLLSWASAAGLGTADQCISENDSLYKYLVAAKRTVSNNLLKMAVSLGDIEMAKELISRGYQIGDILNSNFQDGLTNGEKENVETGKFSFLHAFKTN